MNRFGVGTSPIRVSVIEKAVIWQYMQLQPVKGWENWSWILPKTWASRMVYGRGYRDIGKKELVEKAEDVFADVTA